MKISLGKDPLTGKYRRVSIYGSSKEDIKNKMVDVIASHKNGTLLKPERIRLRSWLEHWLEDYIRPTTKIPTYSQYEYLIRVHINPSLGDRLLQKITTEEIQKFYNAKLQNGRIDGKGGLSTQTVRHIHKVLHGALEQAILSGKLIRNPLDAIRLPKKTKQEIKPWGVEELQTFLELVKTDPLYPAFLIEAENAPRRGELLGLRWTDVNFEKRFAFIRQTLVRVSTPNMEKKIQLVFQTPKTKRSRRPMILSPEVINLLKTHKVRQNEMKLKYGKDYKDHGLVFCKENGEPIDPRAFTRRFERLSKKAGLPKVPFHSIRNSVSVALLDAGVNPKAVQEFLGHEDFSTTMNIYADYVSMKSLQKAATTMSDLLKKKSGSL